MKIKMIKDAQCDLGYGIQRYEAGKEYEVSNYIANIFIKDGKAFNNEDEEPTKKDEVRNMSNVSKYMIFVVGGNAPRNIIEGYKGAEDEAKTLAKKEPNKIVRVLQIASEFRGEVTVKEVS